MNELTEELDGQQVRVRARAQTTRGQGGGCFVILRQEIFTVQSLMFKGETISKKMVTYAKKINKESIVEIIGTIKKSPELIKSCTQQQVELHIEEIWNLHSATPRLPFNLEDASKRVEDQVAEFKAEQEEEAKESTSEVSKEGKEKKEIKVSLKKRLDHRVIDLRIPANKGIMKIHGAIGLLFREFCFNKDFTEIHSPKILGGTSEGGAEVFRLKYFNQDACLAQSPQLYKQMCIAADFEGVYEVGPVFRAEHSNTPKHLCEFTGMDFEMPFKNHYFEVVEIIGEMFRFIFKELNARFSTHLNIVNEQYPFEPFVMNEGELIKIKFVDACEMLKEIGVE